MNQTAIREIRAEMGRQRLSQKELARRLHWSPVYLWRRLSGPVSLSLDDIEAIAAQLGSTILELTDPPGRQIGKERV